MAKKENPSAGNKLASLVDAKIAAGLSKEDALEVAQRQLEHDEALTKTAAASAAAPEKTE